MYKVLSIVMCLLMLCMALCACGQDSSVSEMASDAASFVESEASEMMSGDNGVVSDGDGVIGNETYNSTDNGNTSSSATNSTDNNNSTTVSDSQSTTEPYM